VVQYNGQLCIKIEDLWHALHQTFNSAQSQQVNVFLERRYAPNSQSHHLTLENITSKQQQKSKVLLLMPTII